MSDIAKCLKENGLGEHAALFAENDIDVDLLAELTDDDLKELGLTMGHRKRLLRAASAGDMPAEVPIEAAPDSAGERRQVTVCLPISPDLPNSATAWTPKRSMDCPIATSPSSMA